jgi:NADH dehydrogenase [ubiquinone] 1 alpha subcomplex assembly factor 7
VNALADHLARRIRATGPITLADYMAEALGHPRYGYYREGDPIGRGGDFITAPEVSQMFGELLGLWCVATWHQMGAPSPVLLVELGPGHGTLMKDALRAARVDPAFMAALRPHLVESSRTLRARQAEALAGVDVAWHEDVSQVPEGPMLLLANEFFDALPIHQFERSLGGWRERRVALSPDGQFRFVLTEPGMSLALIDEAARAAAPIGAVLEVSPASVGVMDLIARRLAAHGGAALIIDYAREGAMGDSFQAVRRHGTHDPLRDPGEVDLSARVDFAALARTAREAGAASHGPIAQAELLERLGIGLRASRLAAGANEMQAADLGSSLKRLLDPGEMGSLFQALAVTRKDQPAPPGFEDGTATC